MASVICISDDESPLFSWEEKTCIFLIIVPDGKKQLYTHKHVIHLKQHN